MDFADDAKYKVAFSSSVGETDMYRDNQCLPVLLRRLNSISVREEEAVEWVKAISGKMQTMFVIQLCYIQVKNGIN